MPYGCKTMSIKDRINPTSGPWVYAEHFDDYWRLTLKHGTEVVATVRMEVSASPHQVEAKAIKMIEEYENYLAEQAALKRRFKATVSD